MPARRLFLLVVVLAVAVIAYVLWPSRQPGSPSPSVAREVPVVTAPVTREDVPMVLRALGQVRSLSSIEVRPQVDGLLTQLPIPEGQQVKRGQLLASIDDRALRAALEQTRAERDTTQAELAIAQLDLKRYQNLVRDRAAPAQTLDQQQALVARLKATLATRAAAVESAEVQLSYTRILSPIDGRVGIRNAYVGSLVRASDAMGLFSVVQTDPISIEATLPQSRLPEVQRMLALPERAPVLAYYEDGGEPVAKGQISLLDNRVAADTGTIRVKATFENADERLWPDQSVVVALRLRLLENALTVPPVAVRQGPKGTFVWRIREGKADTVPVDVVYETSELVVLEGIEAGEQVVVDGQSRLTPGVAVKSVDSQRSLTAENRP